MTTITFDTLKFSERLRSAGISDEQAKATAEAMRDALAESLDTSLATKNDIIQLETKISELRFELIKWMIGLFFAQSALFIGILFKIMP